MYIAHEDRLSTNAVLNLKEAPKQHGSDHGQCHKGSNNSEQKTGYLIRFSIQRVFVKNKNGKD